MTFRGLEIWDLGILDRGSWTWGACFRAIESYGLTGAAVSALGPSTEGAGTRVCGHVNKEE